MNLGTLDSLTAALLLAWGSHALALPTGAQPVAGNVSVARPDARTLNVTQRSDKAIVNWATFNVSASETVHFAQPAVTSVILNRVIGGSYSEILGRLSANGQVFLVNPLGVTLGTGAQVDAAGFVASTLSISDSDFLSGRYVFSNAGNAGAVINRGVINTESLAALLAPQVANEGTITARLGTVGLAAGDRVSLDFRGDGLVKFSVDKAAVDASVSNQGAVIAEGGQIVMTAQSANAMLDTVINMNGVARATALAERNGTIVLDGGTTGVVAVTGTLDASGREDGARGGTVKVLGDKVGIFDGARIDASGDRGGGTVLVGGNWQGKGPERNAAATFASAEAAIAADAITEGNGGKVVVWSDGVTRAGIDIKARGGAQGGDGGAVEVSGKETLQFAGRVDTSAPAGKRGMLLLDPRDLTVSGAGPSNITGDGTSSGTAFTPDGNNSQLDWATLETFTAADVFVTTVGTGTGGAGDITIAASPGAYNNSGTLSFSAAGDILINASIANAGTGGYTFDAAGNVLVLGGVAISNTGTGAIAFQAGSSGRIDLGGNVTTAGGDITFNRAVVLTANVGISAGAGAVNFVSTVTGATPDGQTLAVANTGTTTFGGAVGTTRLLSLTTTGAGVTQVNGGSIKAVTQSYADTVTLGAAATTLSGTSGTLSGSVNGAGNDLTLDFTNAIVLGSGVLANVNNFASTGPVDLSGTIATTGTQSYGGAVTLTGATVLNATSASFTGGAIAGGNNDLTFNFSNPTAVTGTTFANVDDFASSGPTSLSGTIATNGSQSYSGTVTLAGATVLSGTTGAFTGAPIAGANNDLTLNFSSATSVNGSTFANVNNFASGGGGTTTLSGIITTNGSQTYSDAVTLGADTTLAGTTGSFPGGTITGGNNNLTFNFLGATTVNGSTFTSVNNFVSGGGGTTNLSGNIATNGAQTYNDAVTLGGATVLTGTNGSFTGGINGAGNNLTLSFSGASAISGAALNSILNLTVNGGGTTSLSGNISTTGSQLYSDSVALAGSTTLSATAIEFGSAVAAGANALTLTADALTFSGGSGSVMGTGALTLQPSAAGISVGVAGGLGTLQLDTTLLAAIANGFGSITIGRADGAGIATLNAVTFNDPTTIRQGAGGAIAVSGGIVGNDDASIALNAGAGGTIALGGDVQTAGQDVAFTGTVNLSGGSRLINTAAGNVTFNNAVSGGTALEVTSSGTTTFSGPVGAVPLVSLTANGGGSTLIAASIVVTSGGQLYADAVTLAAANVTLTAGISGITFSGPVAGSAPNAQALTINTAGNTTFNGAVGTTRLAAVTTDALGTTQVNGGSINAAVQTYNDTLSLGANTTLSGVAGNFPGGIAGNNFDLALNFSGLTTVSGGTFVGVNNFSVGNGGTTQLSGTITTAGSQTYGDAVTLTGGVTTLVSTGGQPIALNNTVEGATPDTQSLAVNTGGTTTFGGAVGSTRLAALTTDAFGTTQVNGGSINAIAHTYNDSVSLGAHTTLTGTTASLGAAIAGNGFNLTLSFTGASSVAGGISSVNDFTVGAGGTTSLSGTISTTGSQTYGDALTLAGDTILLSTGNQAIALNGSVNGAAPDAQALTVSTAGTTTFAGPVGTTRLAALATDAGGTTVINTAAITTGGVQNYGDAVTLAAAHVTLTSASGAGITFASSVTGTAPDAQSLAVNTTGVTTFGGAVGATRLGALITDASGVTQVNGGSVNAGTQVYNDTLALGANATLSGTTGSFVGAIAGSGLDLTLNFTGVTTVNGSTFANVNNFASVGGGTTHLSGIISTIGSQTYDDAVTLTGDTTLVSTGNQAVSLNGTVDAAVADTQSLTINTGGATTFGGAVGTTRLAALTTDAGGTTAIDATTITTGGAQSYGDAVTLGANATLTSTGGAAITFAGPVNGAAPNTQSLTVNTTGTTTFGAAVGATRLAALTTDAGGTTQMNGGSIDAGTQTYNDTLTLGANTTLTGTTGTFAGAIAGGGFDLALNFSGPTTVSGTTFSGVNNFSVGNGGTTMLSGTITTAGSQAYNDDVALSGHTTLTSAGNQAISLNGTVDGTVDDAQALTVNTGGVTTLGGPIGGATRLASLATDAGGMTVINAAAIVTGGAQSYGDNVALGANTVVTSAGGSAIAFGGAVDGARTLTVNTTGATTFGGAVGAGTALTSLTTDAGGTTQVNGGAVGAGAQIFNDALTLGASTTFTGTSGAFAGAITGGGFDLALNFTGPTTVDGAAFTAVNNFSTGGGGATHLSGTISTTGSQTYNEAVTLTGATVLTSSGNQAIALNGSIDGAHALAIHTAGVTSFGAAAGATTALASVTTDAGGTTAINGGGIRTTGGQTYDDAVIVNATATLTSTGGSAVAFNGTVDGPGSLTVNTAGATAFNGAVGATTALASLATDAPGMVALNGGAITTAGAQTYNEPVLLGTATTLTSTGAGDIGFGGVVNGAHALAVNSAGATTFGATVGGTTPLASIATDAGGSTAINGATVATSGAQIYGDAVVLAGATLFSSAGSALAFGGTLTAPAAVTVNGAGSVMVSQGIGNLALVLATPTTASVNTSGNLSMQGAVDQTITLGNSSAGGTLNVDAAGSGGITQLAGTTLSSGGDLRLRAANGEITVGDISSSSRIELNNTGPAPGLTGEGRAIMQHADTELSAPFVRLLGGFNGLGPDGNALGRRTAPIRFASNVQQVDYAAPVDSLVYFAGPIQLQESRRIFLITPPGGTETFDYNGGSGRVASNVAGEVVGGITSQITSQVDASFRPGRIDQAILFGFQGDLSLATLPVFGSIKGVLLPPLTPEESEEERKPR